MSCRVRLSPAARNAWHLRAVQAGLQPGPWLERLLRGSLDEPPVSSSAIVAAGATIFEVAVSPEGTALAKRLPDDVGLNARAATMQRLIQEHQATEPGWSVQDYTKAFSLFFPGMQWAALEQAVRRAMQRH